MNESELLQLIATGECEYIDFKRELNLKEPRQKAEFIKDVIALANSAKTNGFLLVGIDDDKLINGIESLKEEQIQQVIQTYITPNVLVSVHLVSIKDAGFKTVGAIKITPTKKPHYVARAIERLNKDDSFVRRGSTTSALSHHDLLTMLESGGKLKTESKEYSAAGEMHFSLGNYHMAIRAFSKAIELTPDPELFFKRGQAYEKLQTENLIKEMDNLIVKKAITLTDGEKNELWHLMFKDFNDAIQLSLSDEFELRVRQARYNSFHYNSENFGYTNDQIYEDFVVIKESLPENEKAEWVIYQIDEVLIKWDERALNELEDLLNSGYQTSRLYRVLIELHSEAMFNYGIALKLVNVALEKFKDDKDVIQEFLYEKAKLLLQMKKYDEAIRVIRRLKMMGQNLRIDLDGKDLLIRIALRNGIENRDTSIESFIATFLMLYLSRQHPTDSYKTIESNSNPFQYSSNQLAKLDNEIPGLLSNLQEIIREDDFLAIINNDQDFSWSVLFRAIGE